MRYKRNKIITAIIVLLILVIGIITTFLLTGKKFSNDNIEAQLNFAKQYEATLENGYIQPIDYSVEYWTNKPARLMWQYNENYIQDIIQRTITQIQNEGNEIKEVREPKYFTLEPMDSQSTENMEYDFYDVGYNGEIIISQNGVYNYYLTSEPITILFFDKQYDTNIALELERIHAEMHIKIDKIDTIKPTITKALTAKMASTSSISAEVQVKDELSGFSQIEWYYKKSTDNDYTLYATDTDIPINAPQSGNTNSVTKTKTIDNLPAGTYNIKAKIYDVAGNSIESSVATVTVKDIPTLVKDDNVTFSSTPSGWTNGTVSVKVTTNVSGYTLQVSSDNKSWQDGNTITRSTNGQVYARLAYGEFTGGAATYNVSNIDKTAPTVELSQNGGSYVMPTSENATIKTTITAKDTGGSNLNKLQYAWSQSNTTEPTGWTTFSNGQEIEKSDITEPGTWYLWTNVTDVAENRAINIKTSNAFEIKANTETESKITFDIEPTEWTNGEVTVTPKYGSNLTKNKTLTSTGAQGTDYIINGATEVKVKTNGITVTATAQDTVGNTITAKTTINNIDKELPTVTLSQNGGNYAMPTSGNAIIKTTIEAKDNGGSGLNKLEYAWSQSNTSEPSSWTKFISGDEITKTEITEPGTWYLWTNVTDGAGNRATNIKVSNGFMIGSNLEEENMITFDTNIDGWTNKDVTVTPKYGANLTQNRILTSTGEEGIDYQITGTQVIVKNSGIAVTATAQDIAGNTVKATMIIYNIDKEAPIVTLTTNGGNYIMPSDGNAKIETVITAEDAGGSDLKTLEYAWSQSNTSEPSNWTEFTSGNKIEKSDITEPGTWYLWTNVIDEAGNRAENIKVSNAFVIGVNTDNENKITFEIEPDEWTNGEVTVTPIYGTNLTQNRTLTSSGTSGTDYIINGTTNVKVKTNGIIITATAQDKAGNKVKATTTINNIDKELPIVSISPNGGNYEISSNESATIKATLTAEDKGRSGLNKLEYAWSQSNTTEPTEWTKFNNGEEVVKSDITGASSWYLWGRIIDNAGNSNILKSKVFTIAVDEENPEPETHLITYNYSENGGTSVTQETDTKKEGEKINLNVIAQKAGYEFIGWNTNKNATTGLEELEMAKEDVTLYAIYKKDITIQFVDYTDTKQTITTKTLTIFNEETAKTTAPEINEYTGWTAEYWTDKEEPNAEKILFGGEEITDIKENATYYARYSKTYTIKFDLNGGQGEGIEEIRNKAEVNSKNINIVKNAEVTIPEITAIKEGYDAISWNTKADGTGIDYSSGEKALFINDITLFIRWNKEQEEPDEPIPTLPDISVEKPEGWTNKNIPVKIKQTGTTKIVKVMVNGVEIQPTNNEYNYEIEENGTYIVEIVDEDNNTFRKEITVVSIDKTSPKIVKIENTSKDEEQNEVIVNLKLQDEESGVAKVEYSYDGTTWNDCLTEDKDFIVTSYSYQAGESTISMKWTKEVDTKIYFRVTDNVGNVSEVKSTEIKLIQEDPDDNNDDPDNNNSGNNTNNNNNGNNTNNQVNNGNIDNTISKEELPHAGNVKTIMLIASIIALSVIAIVLRKKYKFLKGIIK